MKKIFSILFLASFALPVLSMNSDNEDDRFSSELPCDLFSNLSENPSLPGGEESENKRLKLATAEEIKAEHERLLDEHEHRMRNRTPIAPPPLPDPHELLKKADAKQQKLNYALLLAIANGDSKAIHILAAHGANLNVKEARFVCQSNVYDQELRFDEGWSSNNPPQWNYRFLNITPLTLAIRFKRLEIVQCLIKLGSCPTTADLMEVLYCSQGEDMFRLLLDNDALLFHKGTKAQSKSKLESRASELLLEIAQHERPDICALLLVHGADVNFQDPETRFTPLMCAAAGGNFEVCSLLIERGADVGLRSDIPASALWYAVKYHHSFTVKLLLEHGADPNERAEENKSLLAACLDEFADAESHQDPTQYEWQEFNATLALLLEYGANPNEIDEENTVLMRAANYGFLEAIELLLQYDANHEATNNNGETALDRARGGHHAFDHQINELDEFIAIIPRLEAIIALLSNEEAIHAVKTRRENNPPLERELNKFRARFGGLNVDEPHLFNVGLALFNREVTRTAKPSNTENEGTLENFNKDGELP